MKNLVVERNSDMFGEIKKQVERKNKESLEGYLEQRFFSEFRKFNLDGFISKEMSGLYYLSKFDVYLSFKESEKISLKSLFVNPDNNLLVRMWVEKAKNIIDADKRLNFILVFTKSHLPLMVIFPRFLIDVFSIKEEDIRSYMVIYSEEIELEFFVCKFQYFLNALAKILC